MAFITSGSTPAPASNPESLFRDLPRGSTGPKHLWSHQADILRDYMGHQQASDIAIELPTGAGKTLVGMLIGEWRRRAFGEKVVYLCPTLQLARQAVADARAAGIVTVDLTGSNRNWDANDHLTYLKAEAIAVAHYGAIFNSNPQLHDAALLIFDDAHAAAGTIADNWTVRFDHGTSGYQLLVQLLAEGLPGEAAPRLLHGELDPKERAVAYLVDPAVVANQRARMTDVIDGLAPGSTARYGWKMIRDSVQACCVFVGSEEIIIRPLLPPTSTHPAFTEPAQRLYLSATLGAGGELERAFGRRQITRMAVPEGWDERGTGRRFFVFPELTNDFARSSGDPAVKAGLHTFVSDLMREAGRSLLLTPSSWALEQARQDLVPVGFANVSASQIETSLSAFTSQSAAVLGLANRYDGIDLPDDDCRLIVLAGLPVGADPQERFYTSILGAKRVLQERTRTRFAQGSGRATRNATDRAVVVVLGRQLISFAGDSYVQEGTHPEIRAELEIGLRNSSRRDAHDLHAAIRQFLEQDAEWNTQVEPEIRSLREGFAASEDAHDTKALAAAAAHEIQAIDALWRGDHVRAIKGAERAIAALAGGSELRPYQALWNYLASHWASQAARLDPSYEAVAQALMESSLSAAARTTWIPNRRQGVDAAGSETSTLDELAITGVIMFAKSLAGRQLVRFVNDMSANLAQRGAVKYEQGLVALGKLLGAASHKPEGEARADALWRWGQELWIAWEAKSEAKDENDISADDVRQATTHLRGAASDLDEEIPPGSHVYLVSGKTTVHQAARGLANEDLSFITMDLVSEIADGVGGAWLALQSRLQSGASDDQLAVSALKEFNSAGVLPSQVVQTLSERLF